VSVTIRARQAGDDAAIGALLMELAREHAAALPALHRVPATVPMLDATGSGDIAREVFVATLDGQVIGFVDVRVRAIAASPFSYARRIGFIAHLHVHSQLRRRRVGRSLMDAATAWAAARQCTDVELNVYEHNGPAMGLYDALGFRTLARSLTRPLDAAPAAE
jgi:ribosomal protein S18 acetylase RimI-like enzyme